MIIEGLRKQKAKQIEYVYRNWLYQIEIKETKDDPDLCDVQFFGDCPFTLRYSNLNSIILECGTNYVSLNTSDFIRITLF